MTVLQKILPWTSLVYRPGPAYARSMSTRPSIGTGVLTVVAAGVGSVLARRNRTRAQSEAERREKRVRVQQEVEALASEYHSLLPRASAKSIGAAYARYSTKKQGSIADQVRAIFTFVKSSPKQIHFSCPNCL